LPAPAKRTVDYDAYQDWRRESLASSWKSFDDASVQGKDVLDFGCGDGALGLYLACTKSPRSVTGVDVDRSAIERANAARASASVPESIPVRFLEGSVGGIPAADVSFDVVLAFDCLEHVMAPLPIFREWYRVLRPGGKCLIEWFPFKGPWGPHMESLIPVPWAHVLFGEEAMFRAAERIYDWPGFMPRHWDLDESGNKKPNKWRQWSSFRQQGYVNELDVQAFRRLVRSAGFVISRLDMRSFSGSLPRRAIGRGLSMLPVVGEYFVSYTAIELTKPSD
jgi:SAM-dependent methyltransferase